MKWRASIEELLTFFYDSFSSMTARAEEFFGHRQGVFNTCEVRTSRLIVKSPSVRGVAQVSPALVQALLQFSWKKSDLIRGWEEKAASLVPARGACLQPGPWLALKAGGGQGLGSDSRRLGA